ncbi:ADP-ribosylation factor-like [Mizuhopecten yessoensis]|uniref:ADP-ribosylation factor-like protein 2 n=1 Tax=Mizuhopecten yessoensis TaxID=6573 RepID=A0A210Q9G3_MIZYE|nr:ADP-ribosylation factor-like [Mizuhopecten yessoensis]OWF45355.1 ADP-ribosylation factor-like protein 2 [Mizuhopecten yessoensis]
MALVWLQRTWNANRVVITVATSAATAAIAYSIYRFIFIAKEEEADEYFESIVLSKDPPSKKILVIGLDGAGKTSFVRCFGKGNKDGKAYDEPRPTVGFNVKSVNMGSNLFDVWDVGGSEVCREYWKQFLQSIHNIVWVVDSSNRDRINESREALIKFLKNDQETRPLLIVATKQDCKGAMKLSEIRKHLHVDTSAVIDKSTRNIEMVATQTPQKGQRKGIWAAYKKLLESS